MTSNSDALHPTDGEDASDPTMISAGSTHRSEGADTSSAPNDDEGLSPEEINSILQAE